MAVQEVTRIKLQGIEDIQEMFKVLRIEDIPNAIASSINTIAYQTQQHARNKITSDIDRPVPFTRAAARYRGVRPGQKNDKAEVYLRDFTETQGKVPPAQYLAPLVHGGKRKDKSFEKALRQKGLLPPNMQTAPGPDARLNAYGNQSPGQIVQIMSALNLFSEVGFKSNAGGKSMAVNDFVWFKARGKAYGVKKKTGVYMMDEDGTMSMIVSFIKRPTYQKQYDFYDYCITYFEDHYEDVVEGIIERRFKAYAKMG